MTMKKNIRKIYELLIGDEEDESGVYAISLVDQPAIEVNWVAFNKTKEDEFVIPDGSDDNYFELFKDKGEKEEDLLKDGWVVESTTQLDYESFSSPNADSVYDTEDTRVRYKYGLHSNLQGQPYIIPTSRPYCKHLVAANSVYRREDILTLSPNTGAGGSGSPVYRYRGGYNCRHVWWKIEYKKDGKIYNNANVNINKKKDSAGREITTKAPWGQPSSSTKNSNVNYDKDFAFKVQNEEKRIVVGPAMLSNLEMPRKAEDGEVYYAYFSAETIRQIAEKFMKNKFTDNSDLMHSQIPLDDVYVIESWLVEDPEKDKAVSYGFTNLPVGSWMVSMKINNDQVWNLVKDGELQGFSVSGYFAEKLIGTEVKEDEFLMELAKIIVKY